MTNKRKYSQMVEALAAAFLRDYPEVKPSQDEVWKKSEAARVIDCVLSLNRDYDKFVVPRVNRFEERRPETTSVRDLRELMRTYPLPHEFVLKELEYNHEARANTLMEVVDYLVTVGDLSEWAKFAPFDGHKKVNIRGFGIAGWQYLRMLFGADTVKPDIRIRQYVEKALGVPFSDPTQLLALFEDATKLTGMSCKDLDNAIWEDLARSSQIS